MGRYSVEIVSRGRGAGAELLIVDTPWWSRWLISLGYRMLKLTNDRCGLRVVGLGYRVHDRAARKFHIPVTPAKVEEFRQWRGRR